MEGWFAVMVASAAATGAPPPRIFCFTAAGAWEAPLVALQRRMDAGIFGCDAHAVLTNDEGFAALRESGVAASVAIRESVARLARR